MHSHFVCQGGSTCVVDKVSIFNQGFLLCSLATIDSTPERFCCNHSLHPPATSPPVWLLKKAYLASGR